MKKLISLITVAVFILGLNTLQVNAQPAIDVAYNNTEESVGHIAVPNFRSGLRERL